MMGSAKAKHPPPLEIRKIEGYTDLNKTHTM
jgi:hypothetical protein